MKTSSPHTFHIPVMGLAYTIDTPVKVARFGISSVISIVEDRLIEMMRKHYYPTINQDYTPISTHEEDYRAKRITDYLNLIHTIVDHQLEKLKKSAFETGSEIVKYFEMLPDNSRLKKMYRYTQSIQNREEREAGENILRTQITAGSIDVNIMSKVDKDNYNKNGDIIQNGSDAVSALRGFAKSRLSGSSIIFSAGMNPRLCNYLEQLDEFAAGENGEFEKKIVVKVSDFRSALIQGKYLAKKGIWVSEFRIESGLNCGGHAFATDGYLMGPILEEFKKGKEELVNSLFELYNKAIKAKGRKELLSPPPVKLTAQGGVGTYEEDTFLHNYYEMESTGWGSPFLLVPEATTVDETTLGLLCKATSEDIILGSNSPLGVRFHYLKETSSANEKEKRILNRKPGSPCTEKHLSFNTEFTNEPICTASHKYQKLKITQLQSLNLPEEEYQRELAAVLDKECLCIGLSNAASLVYKVPFIKNLNAVTICPGPNTAYFSQKATLQTMINHIYGRTNIIGNIQRPHMFIAELNLYISYLKELIVKEGNSKIDSKRMKYFNVFRENLLSGINYYRTLKGVAASKSEQFHIALGMAEAELGKLIIPNAEI